MAHTPIKASFIELPEPTALSYEEAKVIAMTSSAALKAAGYRGLVFPMKSQNRVELLAIHPAAPWRTLHHTWHPRGHEVEWLKVPLEQAKSLIEV